MKILTNKTVYFFPTEHDLDFFINACGDVIVGSEVMREIYNRNRRSLIAFNFSNGSDGRIDWCWSRVAWYRESFYNVITFSKQRFE